MLSRPTHALTTGLLFASVAGCFSPTIPSGSFRCANDAPFCPEGQTCVNKLCIDPSKADASLADMVGADVAPDMGKGAPDLMGVEKPDGTTCTDGLFEGPTGNGSFANAYEITAPGNVSPLQICWSDDVDYYKYTLDMGERLSVRVDFSHAAGDLDAVLYDALNAQVDIAQGVVDDEVLEMTKDQAAKANGLDYRIVVVGYQGATNDYVLQVTVMVPE